MSKFIVRDNKKEREDIVEFWLEKDGDLITLHASGNGRERIILDVSEDGVELYKNADLPGDPYQTNERGIIVLVK